MMHITEDTPPDMLAGAMDLTVHLPSGKTVKMSVERSTPMMDVLVLITTHYNLQVSRYAIEALGMAPSLDYSDKILSYRPNTPLGALDTQHIRVIPKPKTTPAPRPVQAAGHQPFESTFRLKVHLPKNQLYVIRVSRNIYLEDIMAKVCDDKNLDARKYEFRHPGNLDEVLDAKLTLSDYQITEIYIVVRGTLTAFSTNDIMALRREEEKKQMHAKAGGGVFNLIFKRGKNSLGSGSVSSENRSISPTHSDDSRSVTPPAVQAPIIAASLPTVTNTSNDKPKGQPKPPQRKRKPAPKPPAPAPLPTPTTVPVAPTTITIVDKSSPNLNPSTTTTTSSVKPVVVDSDAVQLRTKPTDGTTAAAGTTTVICHSRTSSDSSGYHEASILSDNVNSSLPRQRPKTVIGQEAELRNTDVGIRGEHSRSTSNLATMGAKSRSTTSLITAGRKKKAAPLPPTPASTPLASYITPPTLPPPLERPEPLLEQQHPQQQHPQQQHPQQQHPQQQQQQQQQQQEPAATVPVVPASQPVEQPESIDILSVNSIVTESNISSLNTHLDCKNETDNRRDDVPVIKPEKVEQSKDVKNTGAKDGSETEWKYELPLPPTAFRDTEQDNLDNLTNYETTIVSEKFRGDSVVTSPELFEKLKNLKEAQSDTTDTCEYRSVISEDEKPIFNKLSLESLEKRKSLVYNRELATSFKETNGWQKSTESISSKKSSVISELEDVLHKPLLSSKSNTLNRPTNFNQSDGGLPNFKITTYDQPKDKINIYEDDTIRSNASDLIKSTENLAVVSNDNFKKPLDVINNKYKIKSLLRNQEPAPVVRSGSFSINTWTPMNPIKRSKSQVALNSRGSPEEDEEKQTISKATSSVDISGLQSLGVMKLIQNRLQSPIETKPVVEPKIEEFKPVPQEIIIQNTPTPPKPVTNIITANKQRWTPPDISLGTWSDRPKTEIAVKADSDYKFKHTNTFSGPMVNGTSKSTTHINNNTSSVVLNNDNTRNNYHKYSAVESKSTNNNVSIKVNGSEPISSAESGNVTIRIGSNDSGFSSRFINHTTAVGYRKPLGNVNAIDRAPRPHSIAFDSIYDVSRRPVVTAATLKKSITQIGPDNTNYSVVKKETVRPSSVYVSNERLNKPNYAAPTVKGFSDNRKTWNAFGTLPAKVTANAVSNRDIDSFGTNVNAVSNRDIDSFGTNVNVPFSQMRLKRTVSNKILTAECTNGTEMGFGRVLESVPAISIDNRVAKRQQNGGTIGASVPPPPPPQMPKMAAANTNRTQPKHGEDNRSALLNAIQNFGGKRGLRSVRT